MIPAGATAGTRGDAMNSSNTPRSTGSLPRAGLLALALAVIAGTVIVGGCHRRSGSREPGLPMDTSTPSPKLSTFVFKEESKLYLLTVGVNAARFHDEDEFVPLTIVLGNKTTRALHLTRESFTLVDPVSGARYGLASVEEARRQGKFFNDRRLMDLDHIAGRVAAFRQLSCNFFPSTGIVDDRIELHQGQFIVDNLYFPRPEGQFLGKTFEFHVNSRDLEAPLFVVFTVPEK